MTIYEREAATLRPGAAGLVLVPYWNTVMNPYWDPAASGLVLGWTTAHRRHHLYRAILEGIAFEHRLAMEGIAASTGTPLTEHVILGGGSRSPLWCQIMADVLGAPRPARTISRRDQSRGRRAGRMGRRLVLHRCRTRRGDDGHDRDRSASAR